jgi:cytochrome c-type biogenesis protein CcmF
LLINNVLLVVTAATVLLGTLYPLVLDALGAGKISVGPPYFNSVFIPLMAPLAVLVGIGAMLRWKRDQIKRLNGILLAALFISLIVGFTTPFLMHGDYSVAAALGTTLGVWTMLTAAMGLYKRIAGSRGLNLSGTPRAFYGMTFAHFGVGVFIIGVTLTSIYSAEEDVRLAPGDTYTIGPVTYEFKGVRSAQGPNYDAARGEIKVREGNKSFVLTPEKRVYIVQQNPMTEAGINAGLTRDVYVSLGEALGQDGAWSVRLYYKPFVRWIWLGGVFMALGGLLAATDKRYRMRAKSLARDTVAASANTA